ncbi:MAG: alpha/beta fold hydrolase [Planctomycetaceae bacterium]|nr:alpha/beta fold hydrolase [Planctomycetaceae bacterium]
MALVSADVWWTASDGYPIHVHRVDPVGPIRGWILLLHGIQSHAGWYQATANDLARKGYSVWLPDRRGSGLNMADRGHVASWRRLLGDVCQLLYRAAAERSQRAPQAPIVLGGISWGGRLATAVAALRPQLLDGLTLLAPGLIPRIGPTPWQRVRLALARRLGIYQRYVPIPLGDPALFSDDPKWQQFIREDTRALHDVTTGFLFAGEDLTRQLQRLREPLHCPVQLLLAGHDPIINNAATRLLVQRWSPTASIHEFPTSPHTLEFGPAQPAVVETLANWIQTLPRISALP